MPEATLREAVNLSEDWMILVFLFTLLSIGYTRKFHPSRIFRLWSSVWNIRTMRQTMREEPNTPRANFLFNTVFCLQAALIAYAAIKCNRPDLVHSGSFWMYGSLTVVVFILYLVKSFTLKTVSLISDGDFSLSEYEYSVFLTNRVLGLVLLPLSLSIVYFPVYQAKTIIFISILMVGLVVAYRLIRSLLAAVESGVTPFYILFYICTLEILPTALGVKWVINF